jgi:hypothetical protein
VELCRCDQQCLGGTFVPTIEGCLEPAEIDVRHTHRGRTRVPRALLLDSESVISGVRFLGGCPGGEQGEGVGGGRPWFGGKDRHAEPGFGSEIHTFVGEGEVADDVVVEVFGASRVGADVVGAPAAPELIAAGGQLADQVVEAFVVRVLAGSGAQVGDGDVGGEVPVG